MPTVRLVCPTGQGRVIAATGQEVAHGAHADVDVELAGRPPSGAPGDEGYDPGSGLLAQPDVWAPVKTTKTKKDGEA